MIYAHRRVRKAASDDLLADDLLGAVPQRRFDREVWVGAFAIAGVVAVLVALFTLTDASMFRGRYTISTQLTDAGGLRKGDPVQMRGVNVGRIHRFGMVPGGVAVRMEMQGEYEVPVDSRVVLRSNGILGGMVAEVIPGRSPVALQDGDAIPGVSSESDLFATATGVGVRADTVLQRAQELLSPRTVGALGSSAAELQTLLTELNQLAAEQRAELAALSGSLRRSAGGVERATTGPELGRALTRVDSLTVRLDATTLTLGRASNSLESVLGRLERGEGTLGRLSRDDSLYNNMNRAAANVNRLAEDIRENPRRYISVRVF